MKSLSTLGIGLSVVFTCLFLALVAEVYYLLWWKKKVVTRRGIEDDNSSSAREFVQIFCCKKPSSLISTVLNPLELRASTGIADESVNVDSRFKPYGGGGDDLAADNFMVFHNLPDLPRLLSTIKEETVEDLESDGSKSRGDISRRTSDVVNSVDTPYLTPISSPLFFTPPLTPCSYSQHGFNPLFESTKEDGEDKWIRASPPPKFKFLRDAEEKLYRKTLMEESMKVQTTGCGPLMNMVKSGKTSVLMVPSCSPSENKDNRHWEAET